MKIIALTEGTRTAPASRIRVYELLDRLQNDNLLSYKAVSYTSEGYCRRLIAGKRIGKFRVLLEQLWHLWAILRFIAGVKRADVVLIQRTLLPIWLQKIICRINPKIVYDFDDAVYLHSSGRGHRFSSMMRSARMVLAVSSLAKGEAIARGARAENVTVIHTPVDCSRFKPVTTFNPDRFRVGWIGSPATSPYLTDIWPELEEFAQGNSAVEFVFIGCQEFDIGELSSRVKFVRWSPEAERIELPALDVGLMPLEDTEWDRGKGGYKLIQYMAAGVATVASPVGANTEIVEDGQTGLFASGPGQWSKQLEVLLSNRGRCAEMGAKGRLRAEARFDCKVVSDLFYCTAKELN